MFPALRASLVVLVAVQVAVVARAQTPTVDEVVARNLEAKGGVEKLRSLQTVRLSGTITAQGISVPMTTWAKRPNLMRQEMHFQNKNVVSAFDGTTAWVLDERRGGGAHAVTGPQLAVAAEEADFDPVLLDYKERGHTVKLLGTQQIDGKPVYELEVTTKAGRVQHYFIDAATGLERRTTMTMEQDGLTANVAIDFSDFREVEGVTMPFSSRQSLNGTTVRQVAIDKVAFNLPIEDEVFRLPAAAK
jgi:outer membrane lipoprotein-sorting protein